MTTSFGIWGGRVSGATAVNDVWSSPDGENWTQVTAAAPWQIRDRLEPLVFNGRLYITGGRTGGDAGPYHNDVWSTIDGITWTEETDDAGWPGRRDHAFYKVGSRMYVSSGRQQAATTFNDIWSSADGAAWTQEADAPWPGRFHNKVTVREGVHYISGGVQGDDSAFLDDVWTSADGINWTETTVGASYPGRDHHQFIAYSTVLSQLNSLVYIDENNNGTFDNGETRVAGATVTITPVGGGTSIVLTTKSDGTYSTPIAPGSYTVRVSNIDPKYNIKEGISGYTLTVGLGETITRESDFGLVLVSANPANLDAPDTGLGSSSSLWPSVTATGALVMLFVVVLASRAYLPRRR